VWGLAAATGAIRGLSGRFTAQGVQTPHAVQISSGSRRFTNGGVCRRAPVSAGGASRVPRARDTSVARGVAPVSGANRAALGAGLHLVWGFAPGVGADRPVSGAGLHLVWGFAPGVGAESARSGPAAPARGANPHTGCRVAAPGALSAPARGANPRTGCRVAAPEALSTPARGANPHTGCRCAPAAEDRRTRIAAEGLLTLSCGAGRHEAARLGSR
jgi:hypothetical protein